MAVYVLGDLHLSFGVDKPMDVFGGAWRGYQEKLRQNLAATLKEGDLLIVAGDLSWGINLQQAAEDFRFLTGFPGEKVLVKGNHDLWWETVSKMERFFAAEGITGVSFLHNNCRIRDIDGIPTGLCGTRGWFFEEDHGGGHDEKMRAREAMRLKASLDAAKSAGAERIYCFMHYPPYYGSYRCAPIADLLESYGVERCYYGHLHGEACKIAFQGVKNGVNYRLVSADSVNFVPILIDAEKTIAY